MKQIHGMRITGWMLLGVWACAERAAPESSTPPMEEPRVTIDATPNGFYFPQTQLALADGQLSAPSDVSPGVTLYTRSVRRDEELFLAATQFVKTGANVVSRNAGVVEEQIAVSSFFVEQSWHFASEPKGQGALQVEVVVENAANVDVSERGFYFGHEDRSVDYSHATWIDAKGKTVAIIGTWQDDHIRFVVPSEVLEKSEYPAVLDPTIGGETVVGALTAGSPTGANSLAPALASSGTQYLSVWRDFRTGSDSDIYAARLTTAGALTDTTSIAVNTAAGVQGSPAAAFINNTYIVAWEDYKLPAADADIRVARINPTSGAVTQLGSLAATTAAETAPRIASRGAEGLMVFQSGTSVMAALYSGGTLGAPFSIAAVGKEASVAANPSGNFLVTYSAVQTTVDALWGQFVASNGSLVGAPFVISSSSRESRRSSASFVGTDFVVAWVTGGDIWGTRVTAAGVVTDTHLEGANTVGGKLLVSQSNTQDVPDLACNTTCMLAWNDRRAFATQGMDAYVRQFDATLAPLTAEGFLGVAGQLRSQDGPRVAAATSGHLATWWDQRTGGAQIVMGTPIAAGAPTPSDGIVLPRTNNRQTLPSGVTRDRPDGTNFGEWFLLWGDSSQVGDDIVGQALDSQGGISGPVQTVSGAAGHQQDASGDYDGTNYLVYWTDMRGANADVYASRISPTTFAALDPAGIPITTAAADQFATGAASNRLGATLIVWHDRRSGNFDIYGAIVNQAGVVVAADIPISTVAGDQLSATVAWDSVAGVFIVAWSDARAGTVDGRDIYASRVSPAGVVLDPAGVVVSNAAGQQLTPDAASSGGVTLIAWEDRRGATPDIWGARVGAATGSLVVADPAGNVFSDAANAQYQPRVTFAYRDFNSRRRFVVGWTDTRSASRLEDIYGCFVEPSTGQRVRSQFAVSTSTSSESRVDVLGGMWQGRAAAIYLYQRYVTSLRTTRTYARFLLFSTAEI